MSQYETIYLLRLDVTDAGLKKLNEKISELVTQKGGSLLAFKDLGVKQLAYQIKKQLRGRYFQLNYQGPGDVVQEIERNLRLSEQVLRFLTVRERKIRWAGRGKEKGA